MVNKILLDTYDIRVQTIMLYISNKTRDVTGARNAAADKPRDSFVQKLALSHMCYQC